MILDNIMYLRNVIVKSLKMLKNKPFLSKLRFDTAENEPSELEGDYFDENFYFHAAGDEKC